MFFSNARKREEEMADLIRQKVSDLMAASPPDERTTPAMLHEAYNWFVTPYTLTPGMIVTQKPHCATKKALRDGQPGIVVEVLDPPILTDKEDSGTPFYREPLDVVIGVVWGGNFVCFHYDSRRLMPWAEYPGGDRRE